MITAVEKKSIKKGDHVWWRWGSHRAYGEIQKEFTEPIKRTIKGTVVTRNATPENPAYLIIQENGNEVLKSASEIYLFFED